MVKVKRVKRKTIKPIKPFKTLEEEANFWDTHSIVDKIDEGTLAGFHQANKTHTITIRFQPKYLQVLREKAFNLGIGPTTLARMWLMEKLQVTGIKSNVKPIKSDFLSLGGKYKVKNPIPAEKIRDYIDYADGKR